MIASNSFGHVMQAAEIPLDFNYQSYRHYIYTRSHHYDRSLVEGVFKIRKGHYLDQTLKQHQYYDLCASLETNTTPQMYFDHLEDVMAQTMRGKQVGILASNGFDSRLLCYLLSRHLDHFHVFNYGSDTYSETSRLQRFLKKLPRQNYTLHKFHHSMAKSSPHYTPRNLAEHADLFLDCFMDLTGNKEHLLYLDAFAKMIELGVDHVVTGCMAGDVRRIIPLYLMEQRESDLQSVASPYMQKLFGLTNDQLEKHYHSGRDDDAWVDAKHYVLGDAQTNYTHPLMLNYGLVQNSLTVYTARALELYLGIDRSTLPGRGGVNMWREYLAKHMPDADPVPYDTGITMDVPLEHDQWIAGVVDIDYACDQMRQGDIFEDEFVDLLRDTYGRQRKPYDGTQTFLNLWAWFANITGQREKFIQSLRQGNAANLYLQPASLKRSFMITGRRLADGFRVNWGAATAVGDCKHPLNRLFCWLKSTLARKGYTAGSTVYSQCRRFLRFPPWQDVRRMLWI